MKNILILFSLLLLVTISSCTKNVSAQELTLDLNNVQYKVEIPSFKDSSEIRYSDIFSKVKYVELESKCNDAYISFATHVEIANNNDIIILDFNNKKILRFDSCGHFLNLIGAVGHGHNEYLYPRSIAYDKYLDQILVWDVFARKLLFYNLDGTISKTLKMSWDFREFKVLDKDHLITFLDYNTGFNYLVATKDGKECYKFEKIPHVEEITTRPTSLFVFNYSDSNDILCRAEYSSIMYKANANGATPFLAFVPKEKNWKIGKPENIHKIFQNETASLINTAIMVNNKIIITGFIPTLDRTFMFCHDLRSGKSRGGKSVINDIYGGVRFGSYKQHKGKDVYYLINPDDFQKRLDLWKKKKDISQKDFQLVSKLAKCDNPIVQICTVKD